MIAGTTKLSHITSNSGDLTISTRGDVGDDVVALLRPVVQAEAGWIPGPVRWHADLWRALVDGVLPGCAAYQVAPGPADTPAGKEPYVMGMACWLPGRSEMAWQQAHDIARLFARLGPDWQDKLSPEAPQVPWLTATLAPGIVALALQPETVKMLGDLERCLFWAMVEYADAGRR